MVTLNINITGEGKESSSASNSNSFSQDVMPNPVDQAQEGSSRNAIPTPETALNKASDFSMAPNPVDFESSISANNDYVPSPEIGSQVAILNADSSAPNPMEIEAVIDKKAPTKPRARATKRKSGSK